MNASLDILRLAQGLAQHAAIRQQAIAQNVANADTPGYRARDAVAFDEYLRLTDASTTGAPLPGRAGSAPPPRPADLMRLDDGPATVAPNGNGVSVEFEMMRATEARQQHEMALGIYSSVRDLMRASLGGGR